MNDLLDSLKDYIDAAKAKAADYAEKAATVLDELAAWVRSQASGPAPVVAGADATRLAALVAECQALPPVVGAGPNPAVGGPLADKIRKLIEFVLSFLK